MLQMFDGRPARRRDIPKVVVSTAHSYNGHTAGLMAYPAYGLSVFCAATEYGYKGFPTETEFLWVSQNGLSL